MELFRSPEGSAEEKSAQGANLRTPQSEARRGLGCSCSRGMDRWIESGLFWGPRSPKSLQDPSRIGKTHRIPGTKKPSQRLGFSVVVSGEGGIRTHGALADTLVFKTRAINHSTTSPGCVTSLCRPHHHFKGVTTR